MNKNIVLVGVFLQIISSNIYAEESCVLNKRGDALIFDDACIEQFAKKIHVDVDVDPLVDDLGSEFELIADQKVEQAVAAVELTEEDVSDELSAIKSTVKNASHYSLHKVRYQLNPKTCIAPIPKIEVQVFYHTPENTDIGKFIVGLDKPAVTRFSPFAGTSSSDDSLFGGFQFLWKNDKLVGNLVMTETGEITGHQYGRNFTSTLTTAAGMPIVEIDCS